MATYHNYVIFTCGKIAKIAVLEVHFRGGEGCKVNLKVARGLIQFYMYLYSHIRIFLQPQRLHGNEV